MSLVSNIRYLYRTSRLKRVGGIGRNLFFMDELSYNKEMVGNCDTLFDLDEEHYKRSLAETSKEIGYRKLERDRNNVFFGGDNIKWVDVDTTTSYSASIETLSYYINNITEESCVDYFLEDLGYNDIPKDIWRLLWNYAKEKSSLNYKDVISIEESKYSNYIDFIIVVNSKEKLKEIHLRDFNTDLFKVSEKGYFTGLKTEIFSEVVDIINKNI